MAKQVIVTVPKYSKSSGIYVQRITAMLRRGEMPPGIVSASKEEGKTCAWIMLAKPDWEKKIKTLELV